MQEILINQLIKRIEVLESIMLNKTELVSKKDKTKYLGNVYLKQSEYDYLVEWYGEGVTKNWIEKLSLYIEQKGKDPYKSHKAVILTWMKKGGIKFRQRVPEEIKKLETTMTEEQKIEARKKLQAFRDKVLK